MRVIICGSRTFSERKVLFNAMDNIHKENPITLVIEGEALGADTLGRQWAEANNIPVQAYHADWKKLKRAAGPIRNTQMLKEGKPDLVVAFIDKPFEESRGTANMIGQAKKAGTPNIIVEWKSST